MPCPDTVNRRLSVAPMMDVTDRHCRYFLRLLSRHVLLYTEMVHVGALLHGDARRFLAYHPAEQPLALQLGGSDPELLATCARMAETAGYVEVNLNAGCPSERVQQGRFGACLMAEPELVAECVAAMRAAVAIPITVKTRLGIDERDSYEELCHFIATVAAAGCRTFILHARKAWLKGLSPKENRTIPPLRYPIVHQLKRDFPALEIIINGGILSLAEAEQQLNYVDGVMIGRAAYDNPYLLAQADQRLFQTDTPPLTREAIVTRLIDYARQELGKGTALHQLTRHILGLYQGQPGARRWRRQLSTQSCKPGAGIEVILEATRMMASTETISDCY